MHFNPEMFCLRSLDSLGAVQNFLVVAIYSEALSSAAALVALATGIIGGAARYAAVLNGRTEHQVERDTAIGFFSGLALAVIALVSEYTA